VGCREGRRAESGVRGKARGVSCGSRVSFSAGAQVGGGGGGGGGRYVCLSWRAPDRPCPSNGEWGNGLV